MLAILPKPAPDPCNAHRSQLHLTVWLPFSGGYVVSVASHIPVARNARTDRLLLTEQQVLRN